MRIRPNSRGIALLLTVGILMLLSLAAVALVGLAGQARVRTGAETDKTSARLLARSGVEYAAARLGQDSSPRTPATPQNQPDDWTYRDERDVPLEKSLNPSYAQTEPYREAGVPNGRFDGAVEPYTDLDGNGRFDSWSGRLRGRYGRSSGTFRLRISGSGGGGGGGINVNSGIIDPLESTGGTPDWDINRNGVPDYRDTAKAWEPGSRHYTPVTPFGRNSRIAFALNQLGVLSGITPAPTAVAAEVFSERTPVAPAVPNAAPPSLPTGIGDLIVARRPLGGYQDLEEMAKLFLPRDWERLRDRLSVRGRRNRSAGYRSFVFDPYTYLGGYSALNEPDVSYFVDVSTAAPETIAAGFAGLGQRREVRMGTPPPLPSPRCEITEDESLKLARFLKKYPFRSGYDLFQALQREKGTLFVPVSVDPASEPAYAQEDLASPGLTQALKAGWAHALAMPDDPGQTLACCVGNDFMLFDVHYWSFATYDFDQEPLRSNYDRHFYLRAPKSVNGIHRLGIEDRQRTTSGPAFALGFSGTPSLFGVYSLGEAAGPRGGLRASSGASASILNEGTIEARTQRDFEGMHFDRRTGAVSASGTFDGGLVVGRPRRDRVNTYPFYSLDACPGLATSPVLATKGVSPGYVLDPTMQRGSYGFSHDYNYYGFGGEVMASSRSWIDPDPGAVFYRPCWDLDQPERPASSRTGLRNGESNFDDVSPSGAKWQRSQGGFVGSHFVYGDSHAFDNAKFARPTPTRVSIGSGPLFFWDPSDARKPHRYNPVEAAQAADNRGDFPLVSGGGVVEEGTCTGWYDIFTRSGSVYSSDGFSQLNPMYAYATFSTWRQNVSFVYTDWYDPYSPPGPADVWHVAFTFSGSRNRMEAYVNGIHHGGEGYDVLPLDPNYLQDLGTASADLVYLPKELRLYKKVLSDAALQAHVLKGRFWTSESGTTAPSFMSALYTFDHPVRLTQVAWDGFVPDALRDATDLWNQGDPGGPKVPLRVGLLLYLRLESEPIEIGLPTESWRTGGCRSDFKDLWQKAHPGEPLPRVSGLKYQVWLDASALDRAWKSPVFDGIEIGFKGAGGYSGLREN